MVSISTGHSQALIPNSYLQDQDWGLVGWAPWLVPVWMSSAEENQTDQAKTLLGNRYIRIDPFLPENIPIDDATSFPELIKIAEEYDLTNFYQWLKDHSMLDDLADSSTFVNIHRSGTPPLPFSKNRSQTKDE